MGESLRCSSVVVVGLIASIVFRGETYHNVSSLVVPVEVGVKNSYFLQLIASVERFQDILPNELVISIKIDRNGIRTAVIMGGNVNVFEGCISVVVLNVDILRFIDVVEI